LDGGINLRSQIAALSEGTIINTNRKRKNIFINKDKVGIVL